MNRLPLFPERPAQSYTIALDGVQYQIRLTYRERTASWYLDLYDEQGEAVLLGRRLSPGAPPLNEGVTKGPPGVLFAAGPDPYPRDGVGLWYASASEVGAVQAASRAAADKLLPVVRRS